MSDFGPRITIKIVESLREDIYGGKLKSGSEIKVMLIAIMLVGYVYDFCCSAARRINAAGYGCVCL